MGSPSRRGARSGLLHHLVDLLQGQTLGLGNDKDGEEQAEEEGAAPDEEHLDAQVALGLVDDVGGNGGDDTVPEPVGCRSESHTLRADGKRIDLTDHDPGSGTPGGGKGRNVAAGEYNETELSVRKE